MGPQRHNWSFPYSGREVLKAIDERIAMLAAQVDESITAETDYEHRLAEHRERLRAAGVTEWARAKLDPGDPDLLGGYHRTSNPEAAFRDRQKKIARAIAELKKWRLALEHDVERDPSRTFKLTADDLEFFGITEPVKLGV